MFFLQVWLVLFQRSGPGHIPIARILTPGSCHLVYHVQAIILGCVLCFCACKMHVFTNGWCLHSFVFQDQVEDTEDSAAPSESLLTLQLKCSKIVVFSNWCYSDVFCYNSPVSSDQNFESSVQLVGFEFGSLLCTTEASNVQVNLPLFPHWFSSFWAMADDKDNVPSIFSADSASEDAQPSTKSSKIKGQSAAKQPRGYNRTRKRKIHNR